MMSRPHYIGITLSSEQAEWLLGLLRYLKQPDPEQIPLNILLRKVEGEIIAADLAEDRNNEDEF